MIYTKVLREYCLQNPGKVFDIALEHKNHFLMIPYHTYIKIIHRLRDEGILIKQSHKAYICASNNMENVDRVILYYTMKNHGMTIGYAFYNEIGVSSHKEEPILILTDLIDSKTKGLGDHKLIKLEVENINEEVLNIIRLLELIQNRSSIIERDDNKIDEMIDFYLSFYNIFDFEKVIKSKKYSFSTICTLDELLKLNHKKWTSPIEVYNRIYF